MVRLARRYNALMITRAVAAAALPLSLAATLVAAGPTPIEQAIVSQVDAGREAAIGLLARSVDISSATENHEGVRRVGDLYAEELRALGFETQWIDQRAVGRSGHLVAEHKGTSGKRVLLIGHLDTVLEGEPFRREGNRALLEALDACSRDLGFGPVEAHDPSQRGAGDVSFVATLVSGLDGLGALGANEHAPGEWMDLESFPMLTKRAALLMHRVMSPP